MAKSQSTAASLTGRITDSHRTVIGTATVQVTNTSTGIHYHGLTNEAGIYYVSDLPPGRYRIEVEKLGFIAVIESDIILHVQDALEVNFEMELGSASESVTVEGGVSRLDTESSSLGTVVERREANELPLNGRNVFNLIALAPSVIPQGSAMGTLGELPGQRCIRQPERGVSGRAASQHYLYQCAYLDSYTGLDSRVQSAYWQSARGVGPVRRRSDQPQHQGRYTVHSRRSLRVPAQSSL